MLMSAQLRPQALGMTAPLCPPSPEGERGTRSLCQASRDCLSAADRWCSVQVAPSFWAEFLLAFTHPCPVTKHQQHKMLAFLLAFHLKCSGKLSQQGIGKEKELFLSSARPGRSPAPTLTVSLLRWGRAPRSPPPAFVICAQDRSRRPL